MTRDDEAAKWNRAWHDQREVTGKAWWQGYRAGLEAAKRGLDEFPDEDLNDPRKRYFV